MENTCINSPKISVIVTIFNGQSTLKRCLDSILNQSFENFELILINDGSFDDSLNICKEYEKKDKRIIIINNENMGAATSRNQGIKIARGKYFCFVDCDDCVLKDYLKNMFELAIRDNADMVMCGYNKIIKNKIFPVFSKSAFYPKGEIIGILPEIKNKDLIDSPCNKLYNKEFVVKTGVLMPDNEQYEDTYFNLSLLKFKPDFTVTDSCCYNYYINYGSTTRRYNPNKLETVKNRARLLSECDVNNKGFSDYYFIRVVFSSIMDMFISLDGKEIRKKINNELNNEFENKANNACFPGALARIITSVARTKNKWLIFGFCKLSYVIKYKFGRLFMRMR